MSESMYDPGVIEVTTSPELKEQFDVIFLGRLEDLGLGNPNGIPSKLETQEQLDAHAKGLSKSLSVNENPAVVGCIDGRWVKGYVGDAPYSAVDRSAGGTFSDSVMTITGKSDVTKLVDSSDPQGACDEVEKIVGETVGTTGKCSHDFGCGACNGAVNHLRSMNSRPVKDGAEILMSKGPVTEVLKTTYDSVSADEIGIEAEKMAEWLEAENWDGNEYTERAVATNPNGVEKLDGDVAKPFSGHAEDAIGIVVDESAVLNEKRMKENGVASTFGLTLGRISRVSDALAGQRGSEGKQQAAISGIMWNLGVANNLCHPNMPIFAIVKSIN